MVLAALPQDTVRLIKSTQVITTPSSIVKELVENSLDAKAATVSVKLEKFGFLRLEVRDNGSGIHPNDVECIAKPHYTSKITSFSDLSSLSSYGFRGEALSSLCAVADVTVTTKRKEDAMGHSYNLNHKGEVTSKTPAATPNGTTIIVKNLFKNVPVRHQYYSNSKHCKEELKKVENTLLALAIAVPSVHITLSHDRVNIFQKSGSANLQGVLMNVFPEISKGFTSRSKRSGDVSIEIFLPQQKFRGIAEYGRSSSDRLFVLVNSRPVFSKPMEKMTKAFFNQGSESCHGRYPVGFVSLTVPPASVDVNLEPNKTKVLLQDENEILELLKGLLEDLYGPLEKLERSKNNTKNKDSSFPNDRRVLDDITCTFAGVSQCTQKLKPPSSSVNNKIFSKDEDFLVDDFLPKRTQENPVRTVGVSACNKNQDGVSKRNVLSLQTLRSEDQSSVSITNASPAPKVVMGRDGSQIPSVSTDQNENLNTSNEVLSGLEIQRMASTPQLNRNEAFPELSLSTIHSSSHSDTNTVRQQSVPSGGGKFPKQQVSQVSDKSLARSLSQKLSSTQDTIPVQAKKLDSDFEDTLSDVRSGDKSVMHESLIGSDGIPVYKIPPLSSNLNDDVDVIRIPSFLQKDMGIDGFDTHTGIGDKPSHKNKPLPSDEEGGANTLGNVSLVQKDVNNKEHESFKNKSLPSDEEGGANIMGNASVGQKDVNDKRHESLIDDDGIPLFMIAPVVIESSNDPNVNELPHHSRDTVNSTEVKPASNLERMDIPDESSNFDQNNKNLSNPTSSEQDAKKESYNNGEGCERKPGNWSRGISEDGQDIQTVQLLRPQHGTLGNSKSSPPKSEGKRLLSSLDHTPTPPKKKKLSSLSPASFDYVHSKAVKKPSSAFILFSRDIRAQVLSENAGADFAWVAKEMADRWKTLDSESKKHYQDMAKEDNERYQNEIRKIKESRGLNSTLEMTPPNRLGNRATLDRFVAPLTPELINKGGKIVQKQPVVSKQPWKEHKKDIDITIDRIKQKIDKRFKTAPASDLDPLKLIGSLANDVGWICLKDNAVNTLNVSRLQETILCRKLFQTFNLPAPTLSDPIPFNASVIGENSWALLLKLKREEVVGQNVYTITDRRLTMNGFKVALYPSSSNNTLMSHGEIIGMSNNLGFYGLNDLKEILSVLVTNPSATINQTRPLKLKFWLKGETVRMVRSSDNTCARDIREKLNLWKQIQHSMEGTDRKAWDEAKCIHDKQIFTFLHSLDDLPFSQSQTQS